MSCCAALCRVASRRAVARCTVARCGALCRGLALCRGGSVEVSLACVMVRSAGRSLAGWWLGGALRCWCLAGSVLWGLGRAARAGGDAFPWGAWPRDAAPDTHRQAGRQSTVLTGASSRSCHVTKRFRILATLKQGNKSMYSNTSGYVHMGLRLDWGKGITGQ